MRLLFVAFITVLAVVLLTSFAQAGVLPQGETGEAQSIGDHTWGGDPDDPGYNRWMSWWAFIMDIIYFSPLDVI